METSFSGTGNNGTRKNVRSLPGLLNFDFVRSVSQPRHRNVPRGQGWQRHLVPEGHQEEGHHTAAPALQQRHAVHEVQGHRGECVRVRGCLRDATAKHVRGLAHVRVYPAFQEPIFYQNEVEVPPARMQKMQDAVNLMEPIIGEGGWLVGSHPTVADCCCAANICTLEVSMASCSNDFIA